jgi:nickel/cobalt transporter (NiCoT) family protein
LIQTAREKHSNIPGLRRVPFPALGIITLLILVNAGVWAVAGILLRFHPSLASTAILSYTLGLRHALDADHISAIDLMTRRLIASGQRPVTVGTYFSLGHSTIVIVTSIIVAATAAAVSERFDAFGTVGGIIGTSISAAFLLLLGLMNVYILYRLVLQLRIVIAISPDQSEQQQQQQAWEVRGGGCLFLALKKLFKLIDRPWKMYPLGVMFGLGFDTSSEIALLGISSIHGAQGTSIWLIMIFPILFTAGMCLVDTIDGALMLTLYILPSGTTKPKPGTNNEITNPNDLEQQQQQQQQQEQGRPQSQRAKDPLTFLYYSIILTGLTVTVAFVIGTIQLLTLILHVGPPSTNPTSRFWRGVEAAADHYDIVGGAICGSFVVFGGLAVLLYGPWRRWIENRRRQRRQHQQISPASE